LLKDVCGKMSAMA
jgi:hypothetical protein